MLIFVVLAVCGFFVLALSLLFGHDGDHGLDHGMDQHLGNGHGPSIFSTTVISLFITGFGASGAIAAYYKWPMLGASTVGLIFGVFLGAFGFFLANLFYKQQSNSLVQTEELVGQVGTITVGITSGSLGEISVHFKGQTFYYPAKTKDGSTINTGTGVKIVDNIAGTLLVEHVK